MEVEKKVTPAIAVGRAVPVLRLCLRACSVFRFYSVSISCFLFYRGPLLGFWSKCHRDGGSDSIGGKILPLFRLLLIEGAFLLSN
jgi:hypothetical protein